MNDDTEIEALIRKLDQLVPTDGAAVQIFQYCGGLDECKVQANRIGFLRLGIELLRAPFPDTEVSSETKKRFYDAGDLFTNESDIILDWLELKEGLEPPKRNDVASSILGAGTMLVLLGIVAMFIVGVITTFKAIFH